jgi:hypothetical protein
MSLGGSDLRWLNSEKCLKCLRRKPLDVAGEVRVRKLLKSALYGMVQFRSFGVTINCTGFLEPIQPKPSPKYEGSVGLGTAFILRKIC